MWPWKKKPKDKLVYTPDPEEPWIRVDPELELKILRARAFSHLCRYGGTNANDLWMNLGCGKDKARSIVKWLVENGRAEFTGE